MQNQIKGSMRVGFNIQLIISILGSFAAAIVTFMRFFPRLKARYDYGLLIFILTFSLVSVSGYRNDQVLKMAYERLSTIIVGSCTSVIVCICICPVWVGEDLHNAVAANMEKLGNFLEGTKSNSLVDKLITYML